jgi:hypothetical protein
MLRSFHHNICTSSIKKEKWREILWRWIHLSKATAVAGCLIVHALLYPPNPASSSFLQSVEDKRVKRLKILCAFFAYLLSLTLSLSSVPYPSATGFETYPSATGFEREGDGCR